MILGKRSLLSAAITLVLSIGATLSGWVSHASDRVTELIHVAFPVTVPRELDILPATTTVRTLGLPQFRSFRERLLARETEDWGGLGLSLT